MFKYIRKINYNPEEGIKDNFCSLARNTFALASLGSVFMSGTHRELIQLAMRVSAGYVIRNQKQALLASDFSTCYNFVVAESVS